MGVSSQIDIKSLSKKNLLRPWQQQQMKQHIRQGEQLMRSGQVEFGSHVIDLEVLQENMDRTKGMLESGTPPDLSPTEKRRLYKLQDELGKEIAHAMPSDEQMMRPSSLNIDAHMAWEKANKEKILAWKTMRRLVDPGNEEPNFTNIEILRPQQPSYRDMRSYWSNYPDFEDEVYDDMAEVDEELVSQVGYYCYIGWAEKNICKKLDITRDQYRLALQQLRDMQDAVQDDERIEDVINPEIKQEEIKEEAKVLLKDLIGKPQKERKQPSDYIVEILKTGPKTKEIMKSMCEDYGLEEKKFNTGFYHLKNKKNKEFFIQETDDGLWELKEMEGDTEGDKDVDLETDK